MNIAEVIAWKFDHQEGMVCREDSKGVLQIAEFPDKIPTKETQAKWETEYQAYIDGGGERVFRHD